MSPEDVMVELRIKMHRDGTFSTQIGADPSLGENVLGILLRGLIMAQLEEFAEISHGTRKSEPK